ncbi:MAG: efflux transporter outer membrane subunit [Rhodocyclaceae bacterium]|uniref:efflux transporter outer membrane subunit n=1 Tax=Accumulibacter sp. TaxID=2053492 RepID=UPI001A522AA2|nr:efflux transporter outer membrane subunit [Accumulibacter sp.]MBL8494967.1 efflux transporter outer membrane subunit [Rhodocyclaceae bacterium]HNH93066.1 efflux transporter outer membrane subunit [Accumulibacter sp.]
MMMTGSRCIVLLAASLLAGCAGVSETYQRPSAEIPARWSVGGAGQRADWPDRQWWSAFGSRELDAMIGDALDANHEVRAAAARVAQARASARIASAGLYPALGADASAGRSKSSGANARNSVGSGLQASYEIDLWGLNRETAKAGDAALLASEFGQEGVRLSLTADLANAYFLLLSINDRLRTAENNLSVARRLLELVEVQKQAGRVSALEVERQRSQVASSEAAIAPLRQQRQVARDSLALLLARNPDRAPDSQEALRDLALPTIGAGVPAELIERRPDVRQAEANLVAANANLNAARAAVLPSLTLGFGGGWQAATIGALLDSGSGFYSLAATLAGTIFDGGRKRGQVEVAAARRVELVENYLGAVRAAFRDVDDALAGIEQLAMQEAQQAAAAGHAREALRLAELRYKAGAVDYGTVLDAQRTLLSAESAVDQVRLARFGAHVGLYRALGGGWDGSVPSAGATTRGI